MKFIVVAYPRSGGVWLSRLLADALDCAASGVLGQKSIAEEGLHRANSNNHHVYQTQLSKSKRGDLFITGKTNTVNINKLGDNHKIIFLKRDPRDVSVSAWKYWEIDTLEETILAMKNGLWPIPHGGGWTGYNKSWIDNAAVETSYEALHNSAEGEIARILNCMNIDPVNYLSGVAERQCFVKRKEMAEKDHSLPYNTGIQSKHTRKGYVGDWNAYYNKPIAKLAHEAFWPMMKNLGYEKNYKWYERCEE